jgi:hypothetical protein
VKARAQVKENLPEAVQVSPLSTGFKSGLIAGAKKPLRKKQKQISPLGTEDPFVPRWGNIIGTVVSVANTFDRQGQQRRRPLNTRLRLLFILRWVIAKNKPGQGTTLVASGDPCRVLNIPLPQRQPVAPSAFCNARKTGDEIRFNTRKTKLLNA